ncbi:dihydropteroate synthase [Rheinheimera aquimaris]|jgi:dihydropteroate synthase|uniref:dihydropteroate synthase n=1 Tax=Rheinheimera aquimaris TaxID=412437 RepID=UPI000E821C5B|nr:dihydropteroate synthase [Rheinheimera aquimaris]MCD1598795.1 dihydropteroate synthase [Rheinheimera aquimaris]HBN89329.1 dihydropteroate synthase [Rheinheimera sp.]|tara:strand:+ start:853 stop:1686 length:834 start_codon:yes stop_codon:yes gene_type:complete
MQLNLPRQRKLDLRRPVVMGILNVTPDSFSDGGKHQHLTDALRQAERLLADGAGILDIGGESTRPGAADVSEQQELDRVVPVITAIRQRFDCAISVDTSKAAVMSAAIQAGADIINDVRSLLEPGALQVAVTAQVPVCLMHMQGAPRSMQHAPTYSDVSAEVMQFLSQRARQCELAGVSKDNIILDPGFGFGKSLQHNFTLLDKLEQLLELGYPVLAGMSRKSMIGQLLNAPVNERLAGSIACATIAALKGAQIIRVHDVKESVQAVRVVTAMQYGA